VSLAAELSRKVHHMKQLFLCHSRSDAEEVALLADMLRLYGIKPWLDSQGGFLLGDSFMGEARRAIQEDCFGMLIYATPETFERPFIWRIELNAAIQRKERDPNFVLITVLRRMTIPQLGQVSRRHLGVDLSMYHAHQLLDPDTEQGQPLSVQLRAVASRVLTRVLSLAKQQVVATGTLSLQYSTRDVFPDQPDDVLVIDAARLFSTPSDHQSALWAQVAVALLDIKRQISQQYGRPRLRVHGSKHLTGATLFGHIFRSAAGFQIELRHKTEIWTTDCPPVSDSPFTVMEEPGSYYTDSLFVEVNATEKSVRDAVRRYIQHGDCYPYLSLRFALSEHQRTGIGINNAVCCAMALQIRQHIAMAASSHDIAGIHLFGAMPQPLALMIGYHLNALRPVQLYEYCGGTYRPSYCLPMEGF